MAIQCLCQQRRNIVLILSFLQNPQKREIYLRLPHNRYCFREATVYKNKQITCEINPFSLLKWQRLHLILFIPDQVILKLIEII